MTKRENFTELRTIAIANNRTDLVEFIDHEIELLNKKMKTIMKKKYQKIQTKKLIILKTRF